MSLDFNRSIHQYMYGRLDDRKKRRAYLAIQCTGGQSHPRLDNMTSKPMPNKFLPFVAKRVTDNSTAPVI